MSAITQKQAEDIVSRYWKIEGAATSVSSEWGGTFRITAKDQSYLLKIAPPHVQHVRIELEVAIAERLTFKARSFIPQKLVPSLTHERITETELGAARLYSWIDGRVWTDARPHDPALLESLGTALGDLTQTLIGFDHPGVHEGFSWALEHDQWKEDIALLPEDLQLLCREYKNKYETFLCSKLKEVRNGACYHDANDHNILVSRNINGRTVISFIDYGDCHFAPLINDLAICLAYVLMDQDDIPGAARIVIHAYHEVCPLTEEELEVLYDLICLRLVISLAHSARRQTLDPSNEYWQVSTAPAEKLLKKLHDIHPELMLCFFRSACGFEPSRRSKSLSQWLTANGSKFSPILGFNLSQEKVTVFDWSVSSTELGGLDELKDPEQLTFQCFKRMRSEGARIGIGRYDEPRPVYTTMEYAVPGLHTPSMRTIHLGIDLFMPAGTPLYAPFDGTVVTLVNNAGDKEYGPLVILKHAIDDGQPFYTLYGHNNIYTLSLLSAGQEVKAGDKIGEIGDYPENGNWVPHLHFQILTDLLGYVDDFPGVADPDVRDIWLSLCPDPNLILGIRHPDLKYHYTDQAGLVRKRKKILGPNLSMAYQPPLNIVRGWKTSLYDEYGRTYLDTVNNIAHVGHEHPRVVRAGQKQMSVLNTNTRYLHGQILTLSQQLRETLPGHLEVIWLVNSGSEANELALRMGRAFTGGKDTLVLEEGYHGNTQACVEVSHYKFKHLKGWGDFADEKSIEVVPIALYGRRTYEVTDFDEEDMGNIDRESNSDSGNGEVENFAEGVIKGPVVFIHESMPGCGGQIVPHEDFFMDIYAVVKRKGGICIADEVQTGLGRVGSHFWAFELFTIAPDIVTIGKPLGNGHPVAAVACTRDVADAFARGPEFFSSFGGNPVSCAIASEVLSVVEDEGLQSHALELGNYWMKSLRELQSEHPVIGDVRGHGLFIGIEFVDPETRQPSKQMAEYIVKRTLDHRILTSLDGPHGNVMKIKPPMSISREEVGRFLEILAKTLF